MLPPSCSPAVIAARRGIALAILAATALVPASRARAQTSADSARSLRTRGDRQSEASRFDSALVSYRAALGIFRAIADRKGEERTIDRIGIVHLRTDHPDSALAAFRALLPISRALGDRSYEGAALYNIGRTFALRGHPDSALAYYGAGLAIARAGSDRDLEGKVLFDIGAVERDTGHPDSALAHFAMALSVQRAARARSSEAATLNSIGLVHGDTGHPDSALVYLRAALALDREVGNREGEATTLGNIGTLDRRTGHPDSALAYYRMALPLDRASGNRTGEATMLHNIGFVLDDRGHPDSALAYLREALALERDIGDRRSEAATLGIIGAVYEGLGRPDSALAAYREALPLSRAAKDRAGEAARLADIASVYRRGASPARALPYYRRALLLQRATGDRDGEAMTLNGMGLVFARTKQPDSAIAYHRAALPIQRAIRDRDGESSALNDIGEVLREAGRPDSAIAYYRQSLALQDSIRSIAPRAGTLSNMALAFRALGRPDSALVAIDSSVALFARVRMHAGGDANAVAFEEQEHGAGDLWVETWLALANPSGARDARSRPRGARDAMAAALAAAERGRAQALRDLIARSARAASGGALWADDTVPGADMVAEAERELAPLRRAHSALLYYFFAHDTLTTWLLGASGELRLTGHVSVTHDSLLALVRMLRGALGADAARTRMARGGSVEQERDSVPTIEAGEPARSRGVDDGASAESSERLRVATRALGALILPESLTRLVPAGGDLVVVPHSVLALIPFAALPVPRDTAPLGARFALRFAPSIRALGAAEPRAAGWARASRALVVGDPAMPMVIAARGERVALRDLPAARTEGESVARRFGSEALTGGAATETAVRAMLPSAVLVHLATHGLAYGSSARVRDSYVALAPDSANDGLLTIGELLDDVPSLAADLVVLSACQTGLGNLQRAEGTVGFQRALLAKGARSVLVSLWSVDDRATAMLMERFYAHWLGPDGRPAGSKAEALRRAQRDVRAAPGLSSPRYWAAFQLVGAR